MRDSNCKKFKVGDKCSFTDDCPGYSGEVNGADYVVIIGITSGGRYEYDAYKDGSKVGSCYGCLTDEHLTLLSNQSIMNRVSNMMKRLLDGDTQSLVKAGFINGDLEITDKGQDALNSVLFVNNKEELVELAEAELAEEKGERKG